MAGKRAKRLGVYSSPEWIRLRDRARKRAGCVPGTRIGPCESCGLTYALSVHHLLPVAAGGEPIPPLSGVLAICAVCHRKAHFREKSKRINPQLRESQRGWDALLEGNL